MPPEHSTIWFIFYPFDTFSSRTFSHESYSGNLRPKQWERSSQNAAITARPQKVLYGPHWLGGQGFIRWYTLQGEGHIQLFIKFWRTPSQASTLLRVALAWVQYQSGLVLPILMDIHTLLPYLTKRWIAALPTFLASIDSQIELNTH
jgi:hypothetical protein